LDEISVLESVRNGNADAFAEIIEKYQVPIIRYLYRLTGEWETANDLAQDTFIQAYRSIPKTQIQTSFRSWLYKIATNISRQYFRKYKPHKVTNLEGSGIESHSASTDSAETVLENLMIRETLLRLKEDKRNCLLLHFWEGLKYREITEILGISEEAVRKRVMKSCKDFRRQYELMSGENR